MADSEDDVYRRIAKANRTTVEQERAKEAERQRLRADGVGNEVTAPDNSADAFHPGPHVESNPWRAGIITLWVLALLVGIILLSVGASDYAALDGGAHTDPGLVQMFFGSSLITVGVVGFIAWMVGEMVLWKPKGA